MIFQSFGMKKSSEKKKKFCGRIVLQGSRIHPIRNPVTGSPTLGSKFLKKSNRCFKSARDADKTRQKLGKKGENEGEPHDFPDFRNEKK